jgi:predicted ATPase
MKKNAFTLFEAMISIIIVGITFGAILRSQYGIFDRLRTNKLFLERVFVIQKEFWNHFFKSDLRVGVPKIKKIEEQAMRVVSEKKEISRKSSLRDFSEDIYILECVGDWNNVKEVLAFKQKSLNMISFVLKKAEKEK